MIKLPWGSIGLLRTSAYGEPREPHKRWRTRKYHSFPKREICALRIYNENKIMRTVRKYSRPCNETLNTKTNVTTTWMGRSRAEKEGFVVVGKIEGRAWSPEDAEVFYAEHKGKPFFETLVAFMSSGPIVQMCLEKV